VTPPLRAYYVPRYVAEMWQHIGSLHALMQSEIERMVKEVEQAPDKDPRISRPFDEAIGFTGADYGPEYSFRVTEYRRPAEDRKSWSQTESDELDPDGAIAFIRNALLTS